MKKFTQLFLIFNFSFFIFHLCEAQILRVPSQYPTIQQGVDAAGYGDTVVVSPGTYLENIIIQGNAKVITLASNFIFSSDTNDIYNTIIDASQPQNPNFGMGILIKNQDTTIMPMIKGFTITGGTGYYKTYGGGIYSSNAIPVIEYNVIKDCSITGTQPNGGGIFVGGGNPNTICVISHNVIKNCTITTALNGVEANGGGISLTNVKAVIEDNNISNNQLIGNSTSNSMGAGIYYNSNIPVAYAPQLNIINNVISNNTIESWHAEGGGLLLFGYTQYLIEGNTISGNEAAALGSDGYAYGGGLNMYNPAEGSVISANIISDNSLSDGSQGYDRVGGGISLAHYQSQLPEIYPLIEKNRITGNSARDGAGISCYKIRAMIVNNFISGNQAERRAGGMYVFGTSDTTIVSQLINNTITSNSVTDQAGEAGGIFFSTNDSVVLMNNIIYGNQAESSDEMKIISSTVQIHNCDIDTNEITGNWTGENNFYADPAFIDEMEWDCWATIAPCSNAGIDKITAFNQLFEAPDEDIMNNDRPQDDFFDVGAVEVDMCYVGYPEAVGGRQSTVGSYPNPTGGMVDFRFSIFDAGRVTLKIFDVQGREMAVVLDEEKTDGEYTIRWNAEGMPAGVYYYSLRSGRQAETGEIVVLK